MSFQSDQGSPGFQKFGLHWRSCMLWTMKLFHFWVIFFPLGFFFVIRSCVTKSATFNLINTINVNAFIDWSCQY